MFLDFFLASSRADPSDLQKSSYLHSKASPSKFVHMRYGQAPRRLQRCPQIHRLVPSACLQLFRLSLLRHGFEQKHHVVHLAVVGCSTNSAESCLHTKDACPASALVAHASTGLRCSSVVTTIECAVLQFDLAAIDLSALTHRENWKEFVACVFKGSLVFN